jgi:hypothetical protein
MRHSALNPTNEREPCGKLESSARGWRLALLSGRRLLQTDSVQLCIPTVTQRSVHPVVAQSHNRQSTFPQRRDLPYWRGGALHKF